MAVAANNHTDAVRVLVDAGANVTAGEPPPLVLACRVNVYDDIVRELVRGAETPSAANTRNPTRSTRRSSRTTWRWSNSALRLRAGLDKGKYANLLYAVNFRYYDMVEYLLAGGADMYWQGGSLHDVVPMMYAPWQYWVV